MPSRRLCGPCGAKRGGTYSALKIIKDIDDGFGPRQPPTETDSASDRIADAARQVAEREAHWARKRAAIPHRQCCACDEFLPITASPRTTYCTDCDPMIGPAVVLKYTCTECGLETVNVARVCYGCVARRKREARRSCKDCGGPSPSTAYANVRFCTHCSKARRRASWRAFARRYYSANAESEIERVRAYQKAKRAAEYTATPYNGGEDAALSGCT